MGPVSDQGYIAAYCGHYPQIILSFSNFYGHLMSSGSHFKMAAAYNYLPFQFEAPDQDIKERVFPCHGNVTCHIYYI